MELVLHESSEEQASCPCSEMSDFRGLPIERGRLCQSIGKLWHNPATSVESADGVLRASFTRVGSAMNGVGAAALRSVDLRLGFGGADRGFANVPLRVSRSASSSPTRTHRTRTFTDGVRASGVARLYAEPSLERAA